MTPQGRDSFNGAAALKDGKPKRVFENMTIHKQYNEYHELKEKLYAQIGSVNCFASFHIILGVVYMMFLTVSIFADTIKEPVAVLVAHSIVFGNSLGKSTMDDPSGKAALEGTDVWTVYIFKITGFMCAINFILLGTYIAYYKSVVKVDTMKHISSTALYCLIAFLVVGLSHSGFVIYFAFAENVVDIPNEKTYTKQEVQDKDRLSIIIAIAIQLVFCFLECLVFYLTLRKIK